MGSTDCDHPADARDWFDKTLSFRVPAHSQTAFAVCCRACGAAFLPYAESNDAPKEVREEIRAAETTARSYDRGNRHIEKWLEVIKNL